MTQIEQAVFTSAQTDRAAGYQLVAHSPGVCQSDAQALAGWCPSHDSLLELGPEAASVNFHPLPSGAYCVSRTVPAGWEYSGRGGHRVYTQCLIAPPEVLRRFANNPFALLRAASAGGALVTHERVPARLEPLALPGSAAAVDQTLLARLALHPGPQHLAVLVQAVLDCDRLAVAGPPSPAALIAGVLSCLPPECRLELSFSTGLKFSSRRPFRLVALSDDHAQRRWVAHQNHVAVLDLADPESLGRTPIDGWAGLIARALAAGRTSFLAAELSKGRSELTTADLPALGLQLLEDLDASQLRDEKGSRTASPCHEPPETVSPENRFHPLFIPEPQSLSTGPAENRQRADAPHCGFEKSAQTTAAASLAPAGPSRSLHPDSPNVVQQLEHLDDVVYEAINGSVAALEELQTLWPAVLAELGETLVAESREQYLRYALGVWHGCLDDNGIRNPGRAIQALEVLCLLFDQV